MAAEVLLVMVGNVLEPAAAEVAEAERNSFCDDAISSSRKERSSST